VKRWRIWGREQNEIRYGCAWRFMIRVTCSTPKEYGRSHGKC